MWARCTRRRGNPLVGFLVTLLALFGVLTAVLDIKEKSLAEGRAMMDGWIAKGVATVRGEAPKAADQAGDAAASEKLKKQ